MQISSGMREALAIGVGALLGVTAAGGALVAFTSDDSSARRTGGIVAGVATTTAAGLGALLLRSPASRPQALMGALGFVGLPSMLATGLIQNRRDFPND
jgi:hypothetical protein